MDPISNVDSDGEVRFTLHMILWRREPNRGRQRQIRIRIRIRQIRYSPVGELR